MISVKSMTGDLFSVEVAPDHSTVGEVISHLRSFLTLACPFDHIELLHPSSLYQVSEPTKIKRMREDSQVKEGVEYLLFIRSFSSVVQGCVRHLQLFGDVFHEENEDGDDSFDLQEDALKSMIRLVNEVEEEFPGVLPSLDNDKKFISIADLFHHRYHHYGKMLQVRKQILAFLDEKDHQDRKEEVHHLVREWLVETVHLLYFHRRVCKAWDQNYRRFFEQ